MQNRRYFFTFIFAAWLGPQLLISQPPDGWFKQYTFPAEYRIGTITFVDSATGWAAGWKSAPNGNPAGVIVHTADAGRSWSEQLVDSGYSWFNDMTFLDKGHGWATGLGTLYKTWEDLGQIYDDRYTFALDIEFVDALTGWVITSGGIVWKTNDGGLTWEQQTINSKIALTTVEFVTPQVGFLADNAGNIYRTVTGGTVAVKERNSPRPHGYALFPNFPNPFNPETVLKFTLPKQERVILEIFTLAGQKVKTLLTEDRIAGEHHVHWDGANARGEKMPSGVDFAVLKAGSQVRLQKMALIR